MSWRKAKKDIWLKVPFEEKNEAKELGARFDVDKKRWFCPRGIDPLKFRRYWRVLDCQYEKRNIVKDRGAVFDRKLKSWVIPEGLDFDHFSDFWPEPLCDFIFNDRYMAYHLIDEGGQAEVYFGFDSKNNTRVAIKLYCGAQNNLNSEAAFNRELITLLEVLNSSDRTLKILDYGKHEASNGLFIVTPYMPASLSDFIGLSKAQEIMKLTQIVCHECYDFDDEDELQDFLVEANKTMHEIYDNEAKLGPWKEHDEVLFEVLMALVETYKKGVLHRDVKPSNIFLELKWNDDEDDLDVKWILGDFGAAKYLYDETKNNKITLDGFSSAPYTPENSKEEKKYPKTKDVYGWGALAVSVICNKIFNDEEDMRKFLKTEFRKNVPSKIYSITSKCLAEKPEDRFENVIELANALGVDHGGQ